VVGAAAGSALKAKLEQLVSSDAVPEGQLHHWESWIGSDECGKGDYFGSLVVAAFALERSRAGELKKLGVKDSKLLGDSEIIALAKQLYERFRGQINCIVLKPPKYNDLIESMKRQYKNLNDLLAWQHGTAILELLHKRSGIQGILVDQFSRSRKVERFLKDKGTDITIVEVSGAEADPAVAAASVIARYQFLLHRQDLNRYYKMDFPKGSGKAVQKAGREFIDRYSLQRLREVAKLHFITSHALQQREIFVSDQETTHPPQTKH